MKAFKLLFIFCAILGLQACASVDQAKYAQGQGMVKTYDATYDDTWDASVRAIQSTKGSVVQENKEEGSIVASYGVSAFSWGERVAVFLKSLGQKTTQVEVVSKRAVAMNVTASNWEDDIHDQIDQNLKADK